MNKKEFDEKYVNDGKVVNCKTEKLANEFLKLADSFGYEWCSGAGLMSFSNWYVYKEKTTYDILDGVAYDSTTYYEDEGYTIVEYKPLPKYKVYKLLVDEENNDIILIDNNKNKGESKCLPIDDFDLGFGVDLAKARLDDNKDEIKRLLEISHNKGKLAAKVNVNFKFDKESLEKLDKEISKELDKVKESVIQSLIDNLEIKTIENDGLDNLKVGDTVLIKKNLKLGFEMNKYDGVTVVQPMLKGCEKYSKIIKLLEGNNRYVLDICDGIYTWTKEMFESKM